MKIKVEAFQCDLCGYVWLPRDRKSVPKACAACKNPNWDKGRKKQPVGRPKKVKPAKRGKKGKPVGLPKPGKPVGSPPPAAPVSASDLHPAPAPTPVPTPGGLSPECKRFQHAACKLAGCGCTCH